HVVTEGYKVEVVDRPGHGRSPQHPDLHGAIPERPGTMEALQAQFIFPVGGAQNPDPYRRNHTQWPGPGVPGSPEVAQFLASQGGSYVVNPQQPAAAPATTRTPANQQPGGPPNLAHVEWRAAGAELLDKIGP